MLKNQTIILGLVFLLFIGCVSYYYSQNNNNNSIENFDDNSYIADMEESETNNNINTAVPEASDGAGEGNEVYASINTNEDKGPFKLKENQVPNDCYPKDQLTPQDLLPQDPNSKWAQVNPSGQGDLGDQNFLNAGYHMGINTVGQTLRNANMQLRSEPPNPQVKVAPWLQSTIEPDSNRRPMEIGGGF